MRRAILTLPIIVSVTAFAAQPPLPVPPIPPAEAPLREAPMPDLNAKLPPDDVIRPPVTLDMAIHRRPQDSSGLEDPEGTRYRSDIDHRFLAIPGIKMHFPFP